MTRAYEDCQHFHFVSGHMRQVGLCEYHRNVKNTKLCGRKRCPHYKPVRDVIAWREITR